MPALAEYWHPHSVMREPVPTHNRVQAQFSLEQDSAELALRRSDSGCEAHIKV
jgi:hypothetical protein